MTIAAFVALTAIGVSAFPLTPVELNRTEQSPAIGNWTTDDGFNETTTLDVPAPEPFFLESIFHFLVANLPEFFHITSSQQVLVAYIQLTPALQCDVRRVLSLYDQRLGESNPHAHSIRSTPVQLGGRECNASCQCDPRGRRALAARTLKVETRAVARAKLRPVARFPLEIAMA